MRDINLIYKTLQVQKKKEGTGRIVMWQQMGILNSFTMEATFAGYNNVHFNSKDLEDMGYHFCDTLLDYCDPDTTKVHIVECGPSLNIKSSLDQVLFYL